MKTIITTIIIAISIMACKVPFLNKPPFLVEKGKYLNNDKGFEFLTIQWVRILGDNIIGEPVLTKYDTEHRQSEDGEIIQRVKIPVRGKYFRGGYIFLTYDKEKEELKSIFQTYTFRNPKKIWTRTYKKVKE